MDLSPSTMLRWKKQEESILKNLKAITEAFESREENQLNIQDDRSLEDENQVDLVEDIQDEEIVLEPVIEKRNRKLSSQDFCKK